MKTIPEIRERLLAMARELNQLASETKRRKGAVTKAKSRPLTPVMAARIRAHKTQYPDLSQAEIGRVFGVNQGTVSEALRGFRDGRKV